MGVYIKGIDRKEIDYVLPAIGKDGKQSIVLMLKEPKPFPLKIGLVAIPMPHGRIVDFDSLTSERFTDSEIDRAEPQTRLAMIHFNNAMEALEPDEEDVLIEAEERK